MFRPKSAGGTRSFLDDLLGNDGSDMDSVQSPSSAGQRQRKSVRFFDDDADDDSNTNVRSRPHSSTLDSLLNPTKTEPKSLPTKSKSDWLGIASDSEDKSLSKPSNEPAHASMFQTKPSVKASALDIDRSRTEPDWISAGLKSRQSSAQSTTESTGKPAFLQQISMPAQVESQTRPTWSPKLVTTANTQQQQSTVTDQSSSEYQVAKSSTQKTLLAQEDSGSEKPTIGHTAQQIENITTDQSELKQSVKSNDDQVTNFDLAQIDPNLATANSATSQSVTYLQTKLRIVALEKSFLEQTVEQMKQNHQEELNAMISLYEQQMRLTSDMYKRHEEMIQDERDRRISELKNQLEHSEKEIDSMRMRYQERLASIEKEWQSDVKRIQNLHDQTNQQMKDEYQEKLNRLEQRIQSENEDNVKYSTDLVHRQSQHISELLAKWEQSAFKIEQLQKTVVSRQEDLVRQQSLGDDDNLLSKKFSEIENQWKNFMNELTNQRVQFEQVIKNEHNQILEKEVVKIQNTNNTLNEEKKNVESMRQQFAQEINEWRQKESIEAEKMRKEREKLKEDALVFEERRTMLETLYSERTKMIEEEQARLAKQTEEIIRKRSELDQEQSRLRKDLLALQSEQQQYQMNKKQFDGEKNQLEQLGKTLSSKADELEKLSKLALQEKIDCLQAMDEIKSLRAEIKLRMTEIHNSNEQIKADKQNLANEKNQLSQQWKLFQEMKKSIVCNLCGSVLNRAQHSLTMVSKMNQDLNHNHSSEPFFYSLVNGGYFMQQNIVASSGMPDEIVDSFKQHLTSADYDGDRILLKWQMTAQQDAASLAEETKFLKLLMSKRDNNVDKINLKK